MRLHFSIRRYAGRDEGDDEERAGASGPQAGLGLQPEPAGVGEVREDGADVLQDLLALVLLSVGHARDGGHGVRHPVRPAGEDLQPEQQDQAHRPEGGVQRTV